jgi:hypothetical protein
LRLPAVLLATLLLVGSSAALSVPLAKSDDRVAEMRGMTDDLIARLGAVDGVESAIGEGLRLGGFEPAPLVVVRSASLEAAILRAYDASGLSVDAALATEVARQAAALDSPALLEVFDAFADAQLASALVLAPADRALLAQDLATTMKLVTFVGSAQGAVPAEWRAMYEERMAALARADMGLAAAASLRLAAALPHLEELAPVEGCGRALDLPFFQIGAPCDDIYDASVLNFIQIDYGGNDQYYNGAGAGIAGVGVGLHVDYGDGADLYQAVSSAQAFALGGVGILYDEGGSDSYNLSSFGQGFGVAGVAILYDGGVGDDSYVSPPRADSIGTKAGGLGGVGILVDEGGSDHYQQDGLDGFVYGAAGVGLLIELGDGDDTYETHDLYIELLGTPLGEFAGPIQVSAEVNGVAVLYEEGGDDTYYCGEHVRQGCQGAGGVGATALLLDLAGNDLYQLGDAVTPVQAGLLPVFPTGQGIAYGEGSAPPGPGLGILRDLAGDDTYVADKYAQGYATGGLGLFLDESGVDTYTNALAALVGARGDGQTWADGLALGIGIDSA